MYTQGNSEIKSDKISCPYCKSVNVLPFEDDESKSGTGASFSIIILTAFTIIISYLVIMVSVYLFYPVILIGIIAVSGVVVRQKEKKKRYIRSVKTFLCISCSNEFEAETREKI